MTVLDGTHGLGGRGMAAMARQNAIRISERTVGGLSVETGDAVFWDPGPSGLGVRVNATGRKVDVVETGMADRHPETARDCSRYQDNRTAAEVMGHIKRGEYPFPTPLAPIATVASLAERHMKANVEMDCKPGTVRIFPRAVGLYIRPELSAPKITTVRHKEVTG